jgi:hypothetical protein
VNLFFAMIESTTMNFISTERQCTWHSFSCKQGQVSGVKLNDAGLTGYIPSEIGLLQNLEELELGEY